MTFDLLVFFLNWPFTWKPPPHMALHFSKWR
jgi:hypothetical protein